MHAEDRHQAILERLRERGSLRVSEMAQVLSVSAITVRRDVESLAERGLLTRVHGGAVLRAGLPGPRAHPVAVTPAVPPRVARADGRPLVLGLIVPAADYYFPEIIKGARAAAAERGIRLVLGISQYDPEEERAQVRRMVEDGVDGLLITPCGPPDPTTGTGVPHVLIERRPDTDAWGEERVVTDHAHGARIAVRHLAEAGREPIALLLREDSPHAALVLDGYLSGLAAVGLPPGEAAVFRLPAPHTDPAERERLFSAFADRAVSGTLTAALVHNDHDAIVAFQRLRARGVDIPRGLALVAYDDEVAALADIPLTAVAPPKRAVGAAAVDLLVHRLATPDRPAHRVSILPVLNIRESTVPPTGVPPARSHGLS
ncbi:substrate-binding domain-containing protein [Streptomyces sp. NPDC091377]|uniref:substrate-binding domain-containing protein n=1 Tax=Streptomyces sp. NPDC091377 TaxID=3365995 RepID=UPI0038096579